ncbi:S8 family peptidase [Pedobacter rhizosphaerae]|uniref:Subtilase family protein n=1 Tax=Pedobacter rhizosphaerae TaxID=390241 RepID=A0A1H9VPG9_9SPHI|nr:S8 family peptidase [Pedobacter rhizosphaerae]SES23451.1 Subtilase family protein [Pedobacter rhizosphaerae]
MSEKLSHVFFRNELEGTVAFKQRTRYGKKNEDEEQDEEETDEIDYTLKQESFADSRINFRAQRQRRIQNRNPALNVPVHQEYIEITFHSTFDSSFFSARYFRNFGLSPVSFNHLNTVVVFAITDLEKFRDFDRQIQLFINNDNPAENVNYNTDIKFIVDYHFFSRERILHFTQDKPHLVINLIDDPALFQQLILPVENRLIEYLNQNQVEFYADLSLGKIELLNAPVEIVKEIADNFDIIQSINSVSAGIVRPNRFNMPEISFGFTIVNADEDLPIIGVIDTGISNQNPLSEIIVNDNNFDLTGTSVVLDSVNHGTSVAGFAALGAQLIPNHIGNFRADARLLPIKVLDQAASHIPALEIIRLIRNAHEIYNVQIFTLTICYTEHKRYNDAASEYAFALDKLSQELNILIFISIANTHTDDLADLATGQIVGYPQHFESEISNLCAPAESMNNITIGAAADNLENNTLQRVSPGGTVPALYSRTFHIDWGHHSITRRKINKMLFKPDVCNYGGDFSPMLDPSATGLKVLSAIPGRFFEREAGSSYAAPLTANLAARLIKLYPSLAANMQTVKAMIINSAQFEIATGLFNLPITKRTHILGNGIPDAEICQYSSKDRITLILEDSIKPGDIKSYPIKLPGYLLDLDRKSALLRIEATLCFKFNPTKNNQVAYCPVHIAFGMFRNLPLQEYQLVADGPPRSVGINDNTSNQFTFNHSWSQDYYYKSKMLSNTQKIGFSISKAVLEEENCTFKIAVNSKLHKLLSAVDAAANNIEHSFSLVITIAESPVKGKNTGNLYNHILAENTMEIISDIENLEGDLEA